MAKRRQPPKPKHGDLVLVHWADITENPVGDPNDAVPMLRVSVGFYVGRRRVQYGGVKRVNAVVTTTTKDIGQQQQAGWCCYPEGSIVRIDVLPVEVEVINE